MIQELEDAGLKVQRIARGYYMSPPTKQLMQFVLEQQLAHGGNEPLRWMADNMVVEMEPSEISGPARRRRRRKSTV